MSESVCFDVEVVVAAAVEVVVVADDALVAADVPSSAVSCNASAESPSKSFGRAETTFSVCLLDASEINVVDGLHTANLPSKRTNVEDCRVSRRQSAVYLRFRPNGA